MKVYCEKVLFNKDTKSYEVIFDFNKNKDLIAFSEIFQLSTNEENETIFILTCLVFEKYRGFKSGFWYELPKTFFENFTLVNRHSENSRLIATLEYDADKGGLLNIRENRVYENMEFHEYNEYIRHDGRMGLHEYMKERKCYSENPDFVVRNVGCGNINEIRTKDFWLIYDLGGDIKYDDAKMKSVFCRINFNQEFICVISHWDLDHYRAILDLQDHQLKKMEKIIVPTKMPNTMQLRKTLDRLKKLKIDIEMIPPAFSYTRGSGTRIHLVSLGKFGNIEIFRSTDGSNINQSGIALSIEGKNKIAVLVGDHHYPQNINSMLTSRVTKKYEFVIPHHGGHAGKFDEKNGVRLIFLEEPYLQRGEDTEIFQEKKLKIFL